MPSFQHIDVSADIRDLQPSLLDLALPGHSPHSLSHQRRQDPLDSQLRTVPLPRGFYARLLGMAGELDRDQWRVAFRDQ